MKVSQKVCFRHRPNALVVRWEPRWHRLAETPSAVSNDSRTWKDDRASLGFVKFHRLGVAEVRALVLRRHRLEDEYGDAREKGDFNSSV